LTPRGESLVINGTDNKSDYNAPVGDARPPGRARPAEAGRSAAAAAIDAASTAAVRRQLRGRRPDSSGQLPAAPSRQMRPALSAATAARRRGTAVRAIRGWRGGSGAPTCGRWDPAVRLLSV